MKPCWYWNFETALGRYFRLQFEGTMLRISSVLGIALLSSALMAAATSILPPLAHGSAVPCSIQPGIRATRSDLVQLGDVSVSISEQASREGAACIQSAALWVTKNGVSRQIELRKADTNSFFIVDIAPDSSAILLSSREREAVRLAVIPLTADASQFSQTALKWMSVSDWVGGKNCDNAFETQGFIDRKHIVFASAPDSPFSRRCNSGADAYSVDVDTHRAKPLNFGGVNRAAKVLSGSVHSCKSDPDVVGACYTTRARLALAGERNGEGMLLWPVGTDHLLAVDEDLIPADLRAEITPATRLYATMLICPMAGEHHSSRPLVCVESAADPRPEPISPRLTRSSISRR